MVIRAIQSEWIFLQRVTINMGDAFAGVKKINQETFLPLIFFGKTKPLSPIVGDLITVPVKKSDLDF